jgi:hypothetical protein
VIGRCGCRRYVVLGDGASLLKGGVVVDVWISESGVVSGCELRRVMA